MSAERGRGAFSIPYIETHAVHQRLGYAIDMLVPAAAEHKPAVRRFLAGRYFEPFSHIAFTRIMQRAPGRDAVHAGAFFGDMLHTLSRCSRFVHAFEPVLENYFLARRNLDRLGLGNVFLFNAGLSDANAILDIRTSEAGGLAAGGGSSFVQRASGDARVEKAPVLRLDDLPIGDAALLHLDVEGHELRALQGAAALIRRCRPVVLLEDLRNACDGFMHGLGYAFCFQRGGLKYWAMPADEGFVRSLDTPREGSP